MTCIRGYGTYQNVITLANIFKLFNPKLLGPSPVMTLHGSPVTVNKTGFHFAVTSHNTLNVSDQIRTVIDTFKSYPVSLSFLGSELPRGLEGGDDAHRHERHL